MRATSESPMRLVQFALTDGQRRVGIVQDDEVHELSSVNTMRELAMHEGILCGVSSGGSVAGALRLSAEVENAVIVAIICDRGDRYLSTGVFDDTLPK